MLDPKEEQRYKRLRRLSQELHLPVPEHFITLEVFDRDGKLIQRHHQRSHSWTRNAYNMIFCNAAGKDANDGTFGAGKLSGKDVTGATRYGEYPAWIGASDGSVDGTGHGYRGIAGEDTVGILVGQGTNAEIFEDYVLQSPIAEGTGANELNHVQSQPHAISYLGTTLKNTLIRYFNNNTVGETSVDVNEVALVSEAYASVPAWFFVMSRDKLASTVTIPSTGQLKVTYTIQLTYPE